MEPVSNGVVAAVEGDGPLVEALATGMWSCVVLLVSSVCWTAIEVFYQGQFD